MNIERGRVNLLCFALAGLLGACASVPPPVSGLAIDAPIPVESFADAPVQTLLSSMEDRRVLFVFDVDNTLLENPPGQFLGSSQWYGWQRALPDGDARKLDCLLDMQGAAYLMGRMQATEGGASADFVRRLQAQGRDVIALTARGPEFRYPTERELARNGFDFSVSTPRGSRGFPGSYRPAPSGRIGNPRPASFQNGIAMLAGQDKGAALIDLLQRLGAAEHYDAVVLFDDDEDNVNDLVAAFRNDRRFGVAFHYQAVDTTTEPAVIERAVRGQGALSEAYGQFDRAPGCDI